MPAMRPGRALLTLGAAPFIAGAASGMLERSALGAPVVLCPFRVASGLPCPLCGTTRAFRHASAGDPAFLQYNAFWVVLALAAIVAGALLMTSRARERRALEWANGRRPLAIFGVLMLGGWIVALANRGAITG